MRVSDCGRYVGAVAIVTGAGSGIGKAIAKRLADEGAKVWAVDLVRTSAETTVSEIRDSGGQADFCQADIRIRDEMRDVVARAVEVDDRLDTLVNCAGVLSNEDFMDVSDQTWDQQVGVHVKGTYNGIWAAAPVMKRQMGGSIVNTASISGRFGRPVSGAYGAMKAAVIHMTYSAAANLAKWNIRVNAVCPGVIQTPMQDRATRERAALLGIDESEVFQQAIAPIPLRRSGSAQDVAAAVAFLASSEASYITAQSLNVDGGWHHH